MIFKFCVARGMRKVNERLPQELFLAILPNFNESDIMEKEAKQASLYVCFDVEKPGSQVKR